MTRPGTAFLGFGLALWLASQVADAQSAEPGNLAPNPDLEIADGLGPAFWEQRTPTDKHRTLSWDADVSKSGRRSVKIENHDAVTSRWRTGHLRDMALKPGSEGLLAAWLKTSHMERGAYLKLYFMTAGDGIAAQPQSQPVNGTSAWTEVRLPFVVPDETAYVMIYLELNGTGTAWYDDVVLNGTLEETAVRLAAPTLTYAAVDFEGLDNCRLREYGRRNVLELPGASHPRPGCTETESRCDRGLGQGVPSGEAHAHATRSVSGNVSSQGKASPATQTATLRNTRRTSQRPGDAGPLHLGQTRPACRAT